MDVSDISVARQAAQTLTHIFMTTGVDLENTPFPRTDSELDLARRFGASEEQLDEQFGAGQ